MNISVIYNDGNTDVYLDPIVKSATWSGDIKQAARKLDVDISNTIDGKQRAFIIEHGRELRLISEGVEIFRGVIFSHQINAKGQMKITAYDENIYLTKSTDTKRFVNKTASAIVRELCGIFGIPTGQIDDTGYVIPKLILRNKSLYDMIVTAITVTQKQTGRKYVLTSSGGKLNLLERKTQLSKFVIEVGRNILDASYSQSIEELRNQIKVIAGDVDKKEIFATSKDDALIKRFGMMQHLEQADSDMTKSQIEQLATQLLKDLGTIDDEATVEAIGIDEVLAGKAIYVREPMTGIMGGYYVVSDYHTYVNGNHTMSLTLSATDDLPVMQYEPPSEEKEGRR